MHNPPPPVLGHSSGLKNNNKRRLRYLPSFFFITGLANYLITIDMIFQGVRPPLEILYWPWTSMASNGDPQETSYSPLVAQNYQYQPLEEATSIRLVGLLPDVSDSQLQVVIHVANLCILRLLLESYEGNASINQVPYNFNILPSNLQKVSSH